MNILYLTNHLNVGGISSYVLTLARGLTLRGHNIYIASSNGELLVHFIESGIIYIPIPIKTKSEISPKILASFLRLKPIVLENKIDIIHSQTRTTQVLGCLLSRKTGIKHISTCHGFFKTRLFRRVFPCWGEKTIAISREVQEHLINDFRIKEDNIRLIYNGVDADKFKIDKKDNFTLEDKPVIGIVARLSDIKGHAYLIKAMKIVLESIPQAQLLIVGEGKMKEELHRLVGQLGIEKNVVFIPSVVEIREVLNSLDLFVMPSLKEGLGLSLMEAMAAGLAVIASKVGGIKSLIEDGYNGLLVPVAEVKPLAEAMVNLLRDLKKRKYLAQNARNFIIKNFSKEKMISETEKLYYECLGPNA